MGKEYVYEGQHVTIEIVGKDVCINRSKLNIYCTPATSSLEILGEIASEYAAAIIAVRKRYNAPDWLWAY